MYGFLKNIDEIVNKEVLMDFAEKRNEIEFFKELERIYSGDLKSTQ